MSSIVTFTVTNAIPDPVDDNVLVFLMPVNSSPDFQFAAWQSLNIGVNGSQAFNYDIDIQVQAQRMDNGSMTPLVSINPGEIWDCVQQNIQGIALVKEDPNTGKNAGQVTADQSAVANELGLPVDVTTQWYVNGSAVVAMPNLNENSLSIFQLEPSLFFRAAAPTDQGFNYTLQQVSESTTYRVPASATKVSVVWSRPGGPGGADTFTFTPPSDNPPV